MGFYNKTFWLVLAFWVGCGSLAAQITDPTSQPDFKPASELVLGISQNSANFDTDHSPAHPDTQQIEPVINPTNSQTVATGFGHDHILVRQAGHWANFQQIVHDRGSSHISSAEDLENTMIDFARFDGTRFARGWMATSALVALQSPEYVAGVKYWQDTYGQQVVLQRLHQNPMAAFQFPGAQEAQAAILRTALSDAKEIELVGSLFKEQSYSMQKHGWANKKQRGKNFKLDAVRMAPKSPIPLDSHTLHALAAPGKELLMTPANWENSNPALAKLSFFNALKLGPSSAFANISPTQHPLQLAAGRSLTMAHILGMAALLILDEPANNPHFETWSDDPELRECIDWSRVHLRQCVAAGHFVFESSFCIAEHQLGDAGKCLGNIISANKDTNTEPH